MAFYDPITIDIESDVVAQAMIKVNENFAAIDGSINTALNGLDPQNSVLTKGLSAAPTVGISVGARYVVAATPALGDPWYGHVDHIAELTATTPAYAWEFIVPNKGFNLTVEDENIEYVYTGASWANRPSTEQHNQLGGLQGGSSAERYHVSQAVSTGLAAGQLPASGEKAALAGTQGTPGDANRFVTNNDVRLTNVAVQVQTITAGEALTQYDLVYCNAQDGGKYYKATNNGAPEALEVKGIVQSASIAMGGAGNIIINPTLITNPAWNLVQGNPQYLGVDGGFTDQKPDEGAVVIGWAASSTSLFFNPGTPQDLLVLDIDGDLLEMDFNPVNYAPALTPSVQTVGQLGAHLNGLDKALADIIARLVAHGI